MARGDREDGVGGGVGAVDDDDDLPRLVDLLGPERVEEQRQAVGAAVGGHDDGGGRCGVAVLHASSGRSGYG
nr:hypothetical protein [Phycicoccus sp. HDW14]